MGEKEDKKSEEDRLEGRIRQGRHSFKLWGYLFIGLGLVGWAAILTGRPYQFVWFVAVGAVLVLINEARLALNVREYRRQLDVLADHVLESESGAG